jgi:hypothetical protein
MTNEHFDGDVDGQGTDPEYVAAHEVTPDDMEPGMGTADMDSAGMDSDDLTPEDLTADKPDLGTNLGNLGDPGHMFDQTNGLVDGLEGNTDGFADTGDTDAADRDAAGGDDIDGVGPVVPPEH